jgi:hypothetical protein
LLSGGIAWVLLGTGDSSVYFPWLATGPSGHGINKYTVYNIHKYTINIQCI